MPANTNPIFELTPACFAVGCTVANTASDGSGNINLLLTGATFGTRVDAVTFRNAQVTQAASSAMLGKVFITDATGSTATYRIVGEVLLAATTRSATVIGANGTVTFSPPLVLSPSQKLGVCTSVRASAADDVVALAYAGDF